MNIDVNTKLKFAKITMKGGVAQDLDVNIFPIISQLHY